jgi:hypothetical protein
MSRGRPVCICKARKSFKANCCCPACARDLPVGMIASVRDGGEPARGVLSDLAEQGTHALVFFIRDCVWLKFWGCRSGVNRAAARAVNARRETNGGRLGTRKGLAP